MKRSFPRLPASVARRLRRAIAGLRAYRPDRMILFGSAARGTADEESDLDLALIQDTRLPFVERLGRVARFIPHGVAPIDVLVYTEAELRRMRESGNPVADAIAGGRVVYEKPVRQR